MRSSRTPKVPKISMPTPPVTGSYGSYGEAKITKIPFDSITKEVTQDFMRPIDDKNPPKMVAKITIEIDCGYRSDGNYERRVVYGSADYEDYKYMLITPDGFVEPSEMNKISSKEYQKPVGGYNGSPRYIRCVESVVSIQIIENIRAKMMQG